MEKTFNFSKIDYMDRGRKDCAVDVTISLEPEKDLAEIKNLFPE